MESLAPRTANQDLIAASPRNGILSQSLEFSDQHYRGNLPDKTPATLPPKKGDLD